MNLGDKVVELGKYFSELNGYEWGVIVAGIFAIFILLYKIEDALNNVKGIVYPVVFGIIGFAIVLSNNEINAGWKFGIQLTSCVLIVVGAAQAFRQISKDTLNVALFMLAMGSILAASGGQIATEMVAVSPPAPAAKVEAESKPTSAPTVTTTKTEADAHENNQLVAKISLGVIEGLRFVFLLAGSLLLLAHIGNKMQGKGLAWLFSTPIHQASSLVGIAAFLFIVPSSFTNFSSAISAVCYVGAVGLLILSYFIIMQWNKARKKKEQEDAEKKAPPPAKA